MDKTNTLDRLTQQVAVLTRLVLLQSALLIVVAARILMGADAAVWAFGFVLLVVIIRAFVWMAKDSRTPFPTLGDSTLR